MCIPVTTATCQDTQYHTRFQIAIVSFRFPLPFGIFVVQILDHQIRQPFLDGGLAFEVARHMELDFTHLVDMAGADDGEQSIGLFHFFRSFSVLSCKFKLRTPQKLLRL